MKIYAWIPARANSKGIPYKNRLDFNGHPLWVWSYLYAKQFTCISRIILSTDDPIIWQQSSIFPDIILHKRSEASSGDRARDYEVLAEIRGSIAEYPDWWIQLRPTYPIRFHKTLETIFNSDVLDKYDGFRTIVLVKHPPLKTYSIKENGVIEPICREWAGVKEPHDAPRQVLGDFYWHNGCIDGIRDIALIDEKTLLPLRTFGVIMCTKDNLDIDTKDDWDYAKSSFVSMS